MAGKALEMSTVFVIAALIFHIATVEAGLHVISGPPKLKVSIYMTSLCKDTKKFLTKDFYPAYLELKEYLDVEFIPWGKARRDANGITCQFGEADCNANKIQSCVMHLLGSDQSKHVDYLVCEFVNLFSTQGNLQCAEESGVSSVKVLECMELGLGDILQRNAELKTSTIPMKFVPTIVYNDVYDSQIQSLAFGNFAKMTCGFLPGVCTDGSTQETSRYMTINV